MREARTIGVHNVTVVPESIPLPLIDFLQKHERTASNRCVKTYGDVEIQEVTFLLLDALCFVTREAPAETISLCAEIE